MPTTMSGRLEQGETYREREVKVVSTPSFEAKFWKKSSKPSPIPPKKRSREVSLDEEEDNKEKVADLR